MRNSDKMKLAVAENPNDHELRCVYADSLDDDGLHDEADRQRQYIPAVNWLKEFAKNDEEFNWDYRYFDEYPEDGYEDPDKKPCRGNGSRWECCGYHQLLMFLEAHEENSITDGFYLGFDTPYKWTGYSPELWQNFEIVTGKKAPLGHDCNEMPPFRCAC